MKFSQSPQLVAVAPPDLAPPVNPAADTLQDLISRKRLAEKNKFKYHLTEADCTILLNNSVEVHFEAGQVVNKENEVLSKMYRVKSGTLAIYVGSTKIKEFSKGYFIGEVLFLRDEMKSILPNSRCVAETAVTLFELNLPFVRQLINADKVMAFKIYRYLGTKFSGFLTQGLTNIANDAKLHEIVQQKQRQKRNSTEVHSFSSEDSGDLHEDTDSSPSSGSRLSVGSNSSAEGHPAALTASPELTKDEIAAATEYSLRIIKGVVQPIRKMKRNKNKTCQQAKRVPFRTFTMDSPSGQCLLDSEKIKFTCAIRQRKIKYNQILDMSKIGKNSVTIIYNVQAKTIFFKTDDDADDFFNLVQSLRLSTVPSSPSSSSSPSPSPTASASPSSPSLSSSSSSSASSIAPLNLTSSSSASSLTDQSDKLLLRNLAVRQDLKKGDVLIAEGDLYQRIYTIVSGEVASMKGEKEIITLGEGETIGVITLFHMRPAMASIVVKSETATVLIISGYKIQELVNTNFPLAVRVFKKAADVVVTQVEYALNQGDAPTSSFV